MLNETQFKQYLTQPLTKSYLCLLTETCNFEPFFVPPKSYSLKYILICCRTELTRLTF